MLSGIWREPAPTHPEIPPESMREMSHLSLAYLTHSNSSPGGKPTGEGKVPLIYWTSTRT